MTTIREIAAKAGYSPAAVSRLLNNDPTFSISDSARNKILETAQTLNYQKVNATTHGKYKIAVIFAILPRKELEDIYYNNLRQSIVNSAKKTNMSLTFYSQITDVPSDTDGILAIGQFQSNDLELLYKYSSICLFIDSNPDSHKFNSVQPNLESIIEQAVNLFVQDNFQSIGFIGGSLWHANTVSTRLKDPRQKYIESHLRELGLLNQKLIYIGDDFSIKTGYSLGNQIINNLNKCPLPNGFIIASDLLAVGVLQAFNEHNIRVPNDTSIISINDIDIIKYTSPPLTTFKIDTDQLAKTAITTLKDNIIFPVNTHKNILLDADIVYRQSFLQPHK
ncbi:LacI family DNA-binding transcriptional regulator [Dellaglioa sp. L3N]